MKDCVKVASHKLANPYYEFTISFGNGCWNGEVSQVKYSCSARGCFSTVKFALRI